MLHIRMNKNVITITCMLYSISLVAGILFYITLESCLSACIIFVFCVIVATRFHVAFGRTFLFNDTGVIISFMRISKVIAWDEFTKIAVYNARSNIGYKDTSCEGIELFTHSKARNNLTPAVFCFLIHPFSYVFCTFSDSAMQPDGMHYPVFYEVDRTEAKEKLGFLNLF